MYKSLSRIWKKLGSNVQWTIVWILHAKFNVGLSVIVPDTEGRVLLGKHVFSGKNPWRLLGGYVNKNENIFDAAKREIKEEVGMDVEPYRILRLRSGFRYRIEITLVTKPVVYQKCVLDKKELEEIGWFFPGEEPESTLESHIQLLKLWKESSEEHVEVTRA